MSHPSSDEPTYGPTETAYRRWVATLGPLSERHKAIAEELYVLAAGLDAYRVNNDATAAAAALARELRQTSAELRAVGDVAVPPPAAAPPTPADEIARRREDRRRSTA